ncbi:unnamed protein product [Discosporangium mesarthrocarpum]
MCLADQQKCELGVHDDSGIGQDIKFQKNTRRCGHMRFLPWRRKAVGTSPKLPVTDPAVVPHGPAHGLNCEMNTLSSLFFSIEGARIKHDYAIKVHRFNGALANPLVKLYISQFCSRTLSGENLEFLEKVRELKCVATQGSAEEVKAVTASLVDTYVRPGSVKEVNVGYSTRVAVMAGYHEGRLSAFDHMVKEVLQVIFSDVWPRFLKSPEFEVLMTRKEMRLVGFEDLDGSDMMSIGRPKRYRSFSQLLRKLSWPLDSGPVLGIEWRAVLCGF